MKKKNSNIFSIVFYILLITVIVIAIAALFSQNTGEQGYTYSDMVAQFKENKVYGYITDPNEYTAIIFETKADWDNYHDGNDANNGDLATRVKVAKLTYYQYYGFFVGSGYTTTMLYDIQADLHAHGIVSVLEKFEDVEVKQTPWIVSYLPYIILIVLFIIFMVFSMRQTGGGKMGSFGKSKARTASANGKVVRFSDVAGCDEEKQELEEVVEYLKNPAKFVHLGAKIPHGVLLVGPPGTGKTLLAKAVAGEAGVPFYSMSGSDFVEMYVGVGASRVRDLFDNARRAGTAIIFIDEIDAVGRQRGAGLGGGHDEREQTLNQLLVEMDGFDGHSGIIVMAATNRPDILDSALLRPGRFDRQITVGYPDIQGREDILKVHAKGKPFEQSVDFHKIAQTTVGFTGADLANLLNEAALLAARRSKSLIGMTEIEDSMIKVTVGTQKKAKRMSEQERRNTAAHEAGHAILSHLLPTQDPVRQISIIPSGRALGYTLTPPVEDKYSESKQEMKERIAMMLGGRVAERLCFGDYTGGASNDIMRATQVARKMVTVYGMSEELGTIHFGSDHSSDAVFLGRDFNSDPTYSQETAAKIDNEIKKIIDEAYQLAWDILSENKNKIDFITEFLLRNEIMDDEQFVEAMKPDATMEGVEALVTEKKRRSEEENKRRQEELEQKRLLEEQRRRELERALGISDDEDNTLPEAHQEDTPVIEGASEQDAPSEDAQDAGDTADNSGNDGTGEDKPE